MNLAGDPVELTAELVNIESVSHRETPLADRVENALSAIPSLCVKRDGNVILGQTEFGCSQRVILAGHLDTVPVADNLPSRLEAGRLYGVGASDMKSGLAVMLNTVAQLADNRQTPAYDITIICYDCEEVNHKFNGLGRIAREHPDWLQADLAFLGEPTAGKVEAGCQGVLTATIDVSGTRAHAARGWLGDNAIHKLEPLLGILRAYKARQVTIDGCTYREGLNAVGVSGGVATNVIADQARLSVNFRFAPDRSVVQAQQHVSDTFCDYPVVVTDAVAGAMPGLSAPIVEAFIDTVGMKPVAKYGWTDVSQFAQLGIPALNYGPGDPNLAHSRGEYVECAEIYKAATLIQNFIFRGASHE